VPQPRDYLLMLMNAWAAILCVTALSVGAGWIARLTTDPVYYATTRVVVMVPGSAQPFDAYYGNLSAMAQALNYQKLATSSQVMMRAIDRVHLRQTPAELAKNITAGVSNSAVIEIVVKGDDRIVTRDTANAVTVSLIEVATEMATLYNSDTKLVLVDAAKDASDKRGSLSRYLALGGGLGFALSVVLVITAGLATDKVLGRGQVRRIVGDVTAGRNG
jgi:capsular polysaccharide biosynthesis protein